MEYRFYLCNTRAQVSDAPAVDWLANGFSFFYKKRDTSKLKDYLEAFDAYEVARFLENKFVAAGIIGYSIKPRFVGKTKLPFIEVIVGISQVEDAFAELQYVVTKRKLLLVNPLLKHRYLCKDYIDDEVNKLIPRNEAIRLALKETLPEDCKIREIYSDLTVRRDHCIANIVTVECECINDAIAIADTFKSSLANNLEANENLVFDNNTFTVASERWKIVYCFEAKVKRITYIGSVSGDRCMLIPLKRPSYKDIVHDTKKCSDEMKNVIWDSLIIDELVARYPNPVDRLNRILEIYNRIGKSEWFVTYGPRGLISSGFVFHLVFWYTKYGKSESSSVLSIEEDDATPILIIINEFYPYVSDRYYATENFIPSQMWAKIKERMKYIKSILADNPYSLELAPYVDAFRLPQRCYEEGYDGTKEPETLEYIRNQANSVIQLFDIFLKWLDAQFAVGGIDFMINVEGP